MKKVLVALLLLLPTQVFAGEIFNGTLGVSSDYVWRGYSQNSGNVAASGGVGVALGSFTMGAWASQVDFDDDANFTYAVLGQSSTTVYMYHSKDNANWDVMINSELTSSAEIGLSITYTV